MRALSRRRVAAAALAELHRAISTELVVVALTQPMIVLTDHLFWVFRSSGEEDVGSGALKVRRRNAHPAVR